MSKICKKDHVSQTIIVFQLKIGKIIHTFTENRKVIANLHQEQQVSRRKYDRENLLSQTNYCS